MVNKKKTKTVELKAGISYKNNLHTNIIIKQEKGYFIAGIGIEANGGDKCRNNIENTQCIL